MAGLSPVDGPAEPATGASPWALPFARDSRGAVEGGGVEEEFFSLDRFSVLGEEAAEVVEEEKADKETMGGEPPC